MILKLTYGRCINKGTKWSSVCSTSAPSTALTLQRLGDRIALQSIPPACWPERVCMWWEKDQLEAVLQLNYKSFSKQRIRASQHTNTLQGKNRRYRLKQGLENTCCYHQDEVWLHCQYNCSPTSFEIKWCPTTYATFKWSHTVSRYKKPELANKCSKKEPASKTKFQKSPSHLLPLLGLLWLIQPQANIFLPKNN